MQEAVSAAKNAFAQVFGDGGRVHVVRAPGRVNLIGEHVDYNDGFVLPMAIDPVVLGVCRARPDSLIRLASSAYAGKVIEFDTARPITSGEPTWGNYTRGVAAEMIDAGIPVCGLDLLLHNTLPVGGGLSSSAAVLVSSALALLTIGGNKMAADRIALLCQQAERNYAGVPCGIMDQTAVAASMSGHAMLLDCRDKSKHFVPLDPKEIRVVIANTMVHHELSDGAYADRVAACQRGVAALKQHDPSIQALRDVSMEQLQGIKHKVDEVTFRRCRHIVTEITRTVDAAAMLRKRRYEDVGALMYQSHDSLREDYEVSCAELDFFVERARSFPGVYGARMTGAGFGGCAVALAQPKAVEALAALLRRTYHEKFNIDPSIFATSAAGGASVLE